LVLENEVEGFFTEDFEKQFQKEPNKGHNPAPDLRNYNTVLDHIKVFLDKSLPANNGTATWKIPLSLIYNNGQQIFTEVDQKYCLENRKLTILKGGCTLLKDCPIDE